MSEPSRAECNGPAAGTTGGGGAAELFEPTPGGGGAAELFEPTPDDELVERPPCTGRSHGGKRSSLATVAPELSAERTHPLALFGRLLARLERRNQIVRGRTHE